MRIMAIDYGDAHTGVAVSDLTGLLAGHAETVHTWRKEELLRRLGEEHLLRVRVDEKQRLRVEIQIRLGRLPLGFRRKHRQHGGKQEHHRQDGC